MPIDKLITPDTLRIQSMVLEDLSRSEYFFNPLQEVPSEVWDHASKEATQQIEILRADNFISVDIGLLQNLEILHPGMVDSRFSLDAFDGVGKYWDDESSTERDRLKLSNMVKIVTHNKQEYRIGGGDIERVQNGLDLPLNSEHKLEILYDLTIFSASDVSGLVDAAQWDDMTHKVKLWQQVGLNLNSEALEAAARTRIANPRLYQERFAHNEKAMKEVEIYLRSRLRWMVEREDWSDFPNRIKDITHASILAAKEVSVTAEGIELVMDSQGPQINKFDLPIHRTF